MKNKKIINSFEFALVLSIAVSICVYYLYQELVVAYFKTRYKNFIFADSPNYLIIIFCCYIVLVVSYFFSQERKMKRVKYWSVFLSVGIIIFFSFFILIQVYG